jgi:hypothetical protein
MIIMSFDKELQPPSLIFLYSGHIIIINDIFRESYKEEIVHELKSNTEKDIDDNVGRIVAWLEQWAKDNAK